MNELRFPAEWSVALLLVLCALCFFGLVCKNYRDNWLQALGLGGMILWALGRATVLWDREEVGFYQFLSHASMVAFGLGTAWKVWKHRASGDSK